MQLCAVLFLTASLPGCFDATPNTINFQRQRIAALDYNVAFDAAVAAVAERFQITQRDRNSGTIRAESWNADRSTDPPAQPTRSGIGSLRLPAHLRRVADVRVRAVDTDIEFFCRIRIQENRADSVRMLRREYGVDDQPSDTPADRDAGTTEAQNAVWRNRRRDRTMERSILASIREIINKSAPPREHHIDGPEVGK